MQSASSANVLLLYCCRFIDFWWCDDVQTCVLGAVLCWYWIFSSPEHRNIIREFYLVFPTAILQRLFEVFFRSWLPGEGEGEADKQIRVKYHCQPANTVYKGQTGPVWRKGRAMISGPPHPTLRLRSGGWLGAYWPPCLPLFLPLAGVFKDKVGNINRHLYQ